MCDIELSETNSEVTQEETYKDSKETQEQTRDQTQEETRDEIRTKLARRLWRVRNIMSCFVDGEEVTEVQANLKELNSLYEDICKFYNISSIDDCVNQEKPYEALKIIDDKRKIILEGIEECEIVTIYA